MKPPNFHRQPTRTMRIPVFSLAILLAVAWNAHGQNPLRHFTEGVEARFARSHPAIHYTLDVSEADTTAFAVTISLRNVPDTFRIAMAKHPEYDDRFFRYVDSVRVLSASGTIVREDSMLWRVTTQDSGVTIGYRITLPPATQRPRAAWRPFLTSAGGLTGGPHAFMYVVGAELAPAHVSVRAPASWSIATGLAPTADPRTFFAENAYVLVESPIFAGRFRSWTFPIDGVPHTIAYWGLPSGTPFDTTTFRYGVERMANEAVRLFGRPPYREYVFVFQDDAYGGLEHPNSVTLGLQSARLASNPHDVLAETAHEFIHTWNLMRIRPAEYRGIDYRQIDPVPTLWFSEGLTIYYADLTLRRAGLPTSDATRTARLEGLIARYFAMPGNSRFSAERVSRVAYNAPPGALGDYGASTHLQGELLGTMLDLIVRDATNGRRSMDDVMRLMLERFGGARGFSGADVERAVHDVCSCNVRPFFESHVRGAKPIDFDRYLGLTGLAVEVTWEPAMRDGQALPDWRLQAWNTPDDSALVLLIQNPESAWGRAGLHSGDRVASVNRTPVRTWQELRQIVGSTQIGDTVTFFVRGPNAPPRTVRVGVTGYDRPVVRIREVPEATDKQRRLRDAWMKGAP